MLRGSVLIWCHLYPDELDDVAPQMGTDCVYRVRTETDVELPKAVDLGCGICLHGFESCHALHAS